ncbi:MAG: aminotransferase class V-fold PLP-dependent enzyme [Flavobacterium sp.]|nr:MAG: aminotransferase class V-fold PLP-dependent enzyme [Flavobacterium sp.]
MLRCQKHLFSLSDEVTYLNCATMSPFLQSVETIGIENLKRKSNPQHIKSHDFFTDRQLLKERFAQLIHAPHPDCVSIIPSVSYGIGTVIKNIPFERGDEIVMLEDQFPSNVYGWMELEKTHGVKLITVSAPPLTPGRGSLWNKRLMDAINERTKVVAIPQVHWSDGTLFNLKAVRNKTLAMEAYLIIDGTQSIGAMPFSIEEIRPDALICGGYKWLMGAYGLGMAYFGERFYKGSPLEDNWINHQGSEDFTNLAKYNPSFKPKASRYDMGESSNFILVPMLAQAIRQISTWTTEAIQQYCKEITAEPIKTLEGSGYFVEAPEYRGHHLFGIYASGKKPMEAIKKALTESNIQVSYRGEAIRVSPHLYNTREDLEKLVNCFI